MKLEAHVVTAKSVMLGDRVSVTTHAMVGPALVALATVTEIQKYPDSGPDYAKYRCIGTTAGGFGFTVLADADVLVYREARS